MPPTNSAPYEIIGMPAEIYIAPIETAFPDVGATPDPNDWTRLGAEGALNYTPDGVKAGHPQSMNIWRSLGSAAPRKVFRTEEDGKYGVDVADMTLEQFAQVMGNTVTHTPEAGPVSSQRKLGLSRGLNIATVALLIRVPGGSPYMGDDTPGNLQYEIPRAQYTGSPEVTWRRSDPAILAMEWMALVDPSASSEDEQLGRIVAETPEEPT